jgi:hypothetical protein
MNEDTHNPIYGDPFDVLISHFEAHDIRFSCNREERRAWFTMNSGSALQKCSFRFNKNGDVLQIHIQYPVMIPEKFRPAVMEFISRANYGLVIGNFELDCNDGEIRYHVSHVMTEGRLEDQTIQYLFGTGMGTADRYFPSLMRVLFAGETPSEAIDLAELHRFEDEESPSRKSPRSKASGTHATPKKPRAKRTKKTPPTSISGSSSKSVAGHSTSGTTTQEPPSSMPPTQQPEGQENRTGTEGDGGKRKAS